MVLNSATSAGHRFSSSWSVSIRSCTAFFHKQRQGSCKQCPHMESSGGEQTCIDPCLGGCVRFTFCGCCEFLRENFWKATLRELKQRIQRMSSTGKRRNVDELLLRFLVTLVLLMVVFWF